MNKVNYFLNKFPDKEWSGPAWYLTTKTDEDNFPTEFALAHFHPLDLGDTSSTEREAEDFAKILRATYKNYPKLKKCYTGLLHSHHSMGAFFSGTDTETLHEMAPRKGFYPSLVVSTKADKKFAFGISYLDQYKKCQVFIGEVKTEKPKIKVPKEWTEIAKGIEEKAKTVVYAPANGWGGYYNGYQSHLGFGNEDTEYDEETLQKGKDIWSKFKNPEHKMGYTKMTKLMRKIGINNPHGVFAGSGYRY